MKKVVLFLGFIAMVVSVSAQGNYLDELKKYEEQQKKWQELDRQRSSNSSLRVDGYNKDSYNQQQEARRVRGTVFDGNNQIQVFLYVIDQGNKMYVTSYFSGKKDMYGQEFTYSVQSYAQHTSFQYDGEISQYYDWKILIGTPGNYVTCYF